MSIPRALIVAPSQTVRLCYSQVKNYNPSAGIQSQQIYRANSIFDPDYTGVGGQPPGADQWFNFYKKVTIVSSTIQLTLLPNFPSTSVSLGSVQGLLVLQSKAILAQTTFAQQIPAMDHQKTSHRVINGANQGVIKLRQTFNIRRDFGHGRNANTESNAGNNPAEEWYYHVAYSNPMEPGVNPAQVSILARICYNCYFHERRADIYDT